MANRRLISKSIHQSNTFLQLSIEDRYLYDELVLYADDDGFCSELTMINVLNNFSEKNYQKLEQAGLIIAFDSVVIIVDWLNNQDLKHHKNTQQVGLAKTTYIRTDWRYTTNSNDENIAITLNDFLYKYNGKKKDVDLESLKETRNKLIEAETARNGSQTAPAIGDETGQSGPKRPEKAPLPNNSGLFLERQGIDTSSNSAGLNGPKSPELSRSGSKRSPNINKYNLKENNINKINKTLPQKSSTANQEEIEQLIKFINSKFKATFNNNDDNLIFFLSNKLNNSSVDQIKNVLTSIKKKSDFTPESNNLCLSYIKNEYPKATKELEDNNIIDDELPF